MMPDSADSVGKGTRIVSARCCPVGGLDSEVARANCHCPLRLCQSGRVSWGRGYSGSGLVSDTWLVQGVLSGGVLGTYALHASVPATRTVAAATAAVTRVTHS